MEMSRPEERNKLLKMLLREIKDYHEDYIERIIIPGKIKTIEPELELEQEKVGYKIR